MDKYMSRALELAREAFDEGEVPVGAVVSGEDHHVGLLCVDAVNSPGQEALPFASERAYVGIAPEHNAVAVEVLWQVVEGQLHTGDLKTVETHEVTVTDGNHRGYGGNDASRQSCHAASLPPVAKSQPYGVAQGEQCLGNDGDHVGKKERLEWRHVARHEVRFSTQPACPAYQ